MAFSKASLVIAIDTSVTGVSKHSVVIDTSVNNLPIEPHELKSLQKIHCIEAFQEKINLIAAFQQKINLIAAFQGKIHLIAAFEDKIHLICSISREKNRDGKGTGQEETRSN